MSLFAVHYSYVNDAALLEEHRPEHRAFLRGLIGSGLQAAGAYPGADEPAALLLIEAGSSEEVESMLNLDPFLLQGAIAERRILRWDPPIGIFA